MKKNNINKLILKLANYFKSFLKLKQ